MPVQHHLIIAGTGRSGTSFLVRYLTALGMDTALSRHGEAGNWSDHANAGLENLPLAEGPGQAPYVLKSPWAGEYIDQILDSRSIAVDALIVPMRDLVGAATSRSIVEHGAIHREHRWMADTVGRTWDVFGRTPGGSVYSLDPLDQARLLGVSFHRMLHSAACHAVPVLMPAFPRMVEDADYLYRILKPVLPGAVTLAEARAAHAEVASRDLVRVEGELGERSPPPTGAEPAGATRTPSLVEIDNVALRREIRSLRQEADRLKAACAPKPRSRLRRAASAAVALMFLPRRLAIASTVALREAWHAQSAARERAVLATEPDTAPLAR